MVLVLLATSGAAMPADPEDRLRTGAPAVAETATAASPVPVPQAEPAPDAGDRIEVSAALLPANEASGLVASRRHPGLFYWLRDGGGDGMGPRAALWGIRLDEDHRARPVRRNTLFPPAMVFDVTNSDWEDVVLDYDDNLWIGDIGANNCMDQQYLYKSLEPEPDTDDPFVVTARYPITFPDPVEGCRTRNAEAMLWLDDELYLFAKTAYSPVYRAGQAERGEQMPLTRVGAFSSDIKNISVSTVSDDRTRLTVAGHERYWVFSATPRLRGDAFLTDALSRAPIHTGVFAAGGGASVEGGAYIPGGHDLLFVAENRKMYLVRDSAS